MNEIKWQNHLKSLKENKNSANFAKYLKILLEEDTFNQNHDDILHKIDNLLLEMTEKEHQDVQEIVSNILKD